MGHTIQLNSLPAPPPTQELGGIRDFALGLGMVIKTGKLCNACKGYFHYGREYNGFRAIIDLPSPAFLEALSPVTFSTAGLNFKLAPWPGFKYLVLPDSSTGHFCFEESDETTPCG